MCAMITPKSSCYPSSKPWRPFCGDQDSIRSRFYYNTDLSDCSCSCCMYLLKDSPKKLRFFFFLFFQAVQYSDSVPLLIGFASSHAPSSWSAPSTGACNHQIKRSSGVRVGSVRQQSRAGKTLRGIFYPVVQRCPRRIDPSCVILCVVLRFG